MLVYIFLGKMPTLSFLLL